VPIVLIVHIRWRNDKQTKVDFLVLLEVRNA